MGWFGNGFGGGFFFVDFCCFGGGLVVGGGGLVGGIGGRWGTGGRGSVFHHPQILRMPPHLPLRFSSWA